MRWQWLVTVLLIILGPVLANWGWGMTSLWPSLVAFSAVVMTRRVFTSLILGALSGVWILENGNPLPVLFVLVEDHFLPHFGSSWKAGAIVFTLLLGGFVSLLEKGGTLNAFFAGLLKTGGPRRLESAAAFFGLVCFFDGLANSLMVGRIFSRMASRFSVSRVRLAYIVDTTSAAVACLAFISTWIAFQLSMIREGFSLAGQLEHANPYALFFASIPFNFYAWFALVLMGVAIWKQWNFGSMKSFQPKRENASPDIPAGAREETMRCLWRAAIPLVFLVLFILVGIYVDGSLRSEMSLWPISVKKLASAFGSAETPVILICGSILGSLLAVWTYPKQSSEPRGEAFIEGVLSLFQPVLILLAAWMLSSTLEALGAADFLGKLLEGRFPLGLLPAGVFFVGALIAFSTGTSWGTMGLLMPLAIPLYFQLAAQSGDPEALASPILAAVVGAVFSGAVFGDHCSPISDTTIVSSIACEVEPIDHVRTQLPYALMAACGALLLGFLPSSLEISGWLLWLISLSVFLGLLLIFSRKA